MRTITFAPCFWRGLLRTVEFEYHGDPIDAKHCHCTQCQRLDGAPFQWAALFHKTSVRLAQHCDLLQLDFFSTQQRHSEHSVPCKISCRNCRSPMACVLCNCIARFVQANCEHMLTSRCVLLLSVLIPW